MVVEGISYQWFIFLYQRTHVGSICCLWNAFWEWILWRLCWATCVGFFGSRGGWREHRKQDPANSRQDEGIFTLWCSKNVISFLLVENLLPIFHVQALQKEREAKLITILKNRLELFTNNQTNEFMEWANSEASRLSKAGILVLMSLVSLYIPVKSEDFSIWRFNKDQNIIVHSKEMSTLKSTQYTHKSKIYDGQAPTLMEEE